MKKIVTTTVIVAMLCFSLFLMRTRKSVGLSPEVKILNPQHNTWYRITRPISENGTIGAADPIVEIDLNVTTDPPGGSKNWTVTIVDTRFGEPSLVNVSWLSPEKISLTCIPPPWPCWTPYPWRCPCTFPWPLPCPFPDWPEPWFFSWSMLEITCEYTTPLGTKMTDSEYVVVEYGLAGESSVETLIYGEDIVGIGQNIDVAILCDTASDTYTKWALAPSLLCTPYDKAWQAGTYIGEIFNDACSSPPINPYMDLDQSDTYMGIWNLIDRTIIPIIPSPTTDYQIAMVDAAEKMIDVDEALEALRVTYYRKLWAEKVGDDSAIHLQEETFKKFLVEYIRRSQKSQAALYGVADELGKIGDIYISPNNLSDFQAKIWTEGFPSIEMEIFGLFEIDPWYIEQEKRISCLLSPEKLHGNLSSMMTNFVEETRETDRKLIEIVLRAQLKGDVDGNGRVDIIDVFIAAKAFGSTPRNPRWDLLADVNGDNIVDIRDIFIVARDFGKTA